MKKNNLENVIGFIFKYIWLFCFLLIVLEVFSTAYTGIILMKQTAQGVLESVSGEVAGRVDGVLRLLQGLAKDERIADVEQPLFDRAILARSYEKSYDLYMIALTDEQVNVISSDTLTPPKQMTSLAYRDYMQALYSTGQYQITDAFRAGADGITLNYTIAVPIMQGDKVAGSVFGAIYFQDIEDILLRNSGNRQSFFLMGKNHAVMSSKEDDNGKTFAQIAEDTTFYTSSAEEIQKNLEQGITGSCWQWGSNGLSYVTYQQVAPTQWTLVYEVEFLSVILKLIPALLLKNLFYIILCGMISVFGRRYLNRHLSSVNHLLNQVTKMQRELLHTEKADYDHLLKLTQQGLIDQLTGVATRAILISKFPDYLQESSYGAVLFIDLDDLKFINDSYNHEAGDKALIQFTDTLKRYETTYAGFAARYGGDEFILILPSQKKEAALQIAEELCRDLRQHVSCIQYAFDIHASIGAACYPEHGTSVEELISKADLALYHAKQSGKDRVACYDIDTK